ncbi:MAG: zinc ribbon domain-containing protein [Candidatus Bilamarchaeaceae archaeon]
MMGSPICQSCGMPMARNEDFGTEKDGKRNMEYCTFCYRDGKFTADLTMEQMIGKLIGFADKMGMTEEEARELAEKNIPKLKRWRS